MTALAKLLEKWLEDDDCSALEYAERLRCADELTAALSPAELGGVETEQSIAADCYHWIAECIGTLPGYSVQEHVQTMKETLEACSDFLHDFVPSDEGGCDEAVELARNCRAVLSGRIDQYEPTPRAAEAVAVDDPMIYRFRFAYEGCPIQPSEHERVRIALTASLTPPAAKGENNNV